MFSKIKRTMPRSIITILVVYFGAITNNIVVAKNNTPPHVSEPPPPATSVSIPETISNFNNDIRMIFYGVIALLSIAIVVYLIRKYLINRNKIIKEDEDVIDSDIDKSLEISEYEQPLTFNRELESEGGDDIELVVNNKIEALLQQKKIYESQYTELLDRKTELQSLGVGNEKHVKEIKRKLSLLAIGLNTFVRKSIIKTESKLTRIILHTLFYTFIFRKLLFPLWRKLATPAKIMLVLAVGYLVSVAVTHVMKLMSIGKYDQIIELMMYIGIIYVASLPVFFMIEKVLSSRVIRKEIKEYVNDFKDVRVIHRPESFFKKRNYYQAMCISTNVRSGVVEPQLILLDDGVEQISSTAFEDFIEIMKGDRAIALFSLKKGILSNSYLWCARHSPFMENYGSLVVDYFDSVESELKHLQSLMENVTENEVEFIAINKQLRRLRDILNNINNMLEIWGDVCISDEAFHFINRRIELFNIKDPSVPNGILLYGIAGNGKEYLSKAISKSLLIDYIAVDLSALKTAGDVRKFWARYRKKSGALLYVNHAEQIFPKDADSNSKDVVNSWVNEWRKQSPIESNVWVVLSTDDPKKIASKILDEIVATQLEITSPDIEGRKLILNRAIIEYGLHGDIPDFVLKITAGSTILELRELVAEVKRRATTNEIESKLWREILGDVRGDDKGLRQTDKKWANLIISPPIKDRLMKISNLLEEADKYKQQGVDVPKGILLYGPPGTGKTEIARTMANESGVFFIAASPSDLKAEHVGCSGEKVRELFSKARSKAPCILFIDEIESVVPDRAGSGGDSFTSDIVTQMLTEMDGVKSSDNPVFVLAATNYQNDIDKAILSRFNEKIEVALPGEDERKQILEIIIKLKGKKFDFDISPAMANVARILKGRSGRDLNYYVNSVYDKEVMRVDNPEDIELTAEKFISAAIEIIDKSSKRDKSKTWERLILPEVVKDRLKSICNILYNAHEFSDTNVDMPKGMLLYGPPGTGKTEVARTLANESGLHFTSVTVADLKSAYGDSATKVAKVFSKAREQSPSIIFIDEIEAIAPDRENNPSESTMQIVNQLLQEIDGAKNDDRHVFVLAATNLPETVDKAIRSRLSIQIEIPLPDQSARRKILSVLLEEKLKSVDLDINAAAEKLAQILIGKSGRALKDFINSVIEMELMRKGSPSNMNLTVELFIKEATILMDSDTKRDKSKTWDNLILPSEIKSRLKQITQLFAQSEQFLKSGIDMPRGMLLYGPPGTGKTEIARTLANEAGMQFIAATTTEIKGSYLGHSAKNVKDIFSKARENTPCILFLDELEALAAKRGGEFADQYTGEIVNQLLQEIDGVRNNSEKPVFVLAATNIPEAIDPAILSRLSDKIEIPLPDREGRRDILKILLSQKIPNPKFDIYEAAEKLEPLFERKSGRDLNQFVAKVVENEVLRAGAVDAMDISIESLLDAAKPVGKSIPDNEINKIWESVILPDDTKSSIIGKLKLFNDADPAAPKGLLLFGPSGTGKTEIARKIALSASCHFMSLSSSDLKAGHVGQSGQRVQKVWEEARSRGRCVMFIDECEGVFGRRGGEKSDSFTDEIVQAFLAEWDGVDSGGQIWVVGATNRVELLDDAILSRFGSKIEIGLPDIDSRNKIMELEIQKLKRDWSLPEFASKKTVGFSGRKLSNLIKEVAVETGKNEPSEEHWNKAIQQLSTSSSDVVDDDAGWHSLILHDDVKEKLQNICQMLKHTEVLENQGIDPPRGMILYGPPGTGKTQIARTIANESGLTFISASTADIKAGYTGQSGQKVAALFERARSSAPAIIFIDEIESVASTRGSFNTDSFTQEIVTQLLQELDGAKKQKGYVFILAATNMLDVIDSAILSRLPEKIEIPLPDRNQRKQIIRYFISKFKYYDFDIEECSEALAGMYDGCSGRDIRSNIEIAQQSAVKRALELNQPERVEIKLVDFKLT